MTMILHRGGWTADRDQVLAVQTPAPTATHHPIAHGTLIDLTMTALFDQGYTITGEEHALNHGGQQYFGLFNLQVGDEGDRPMKTLVAGLRNSHDQTFVAAFASGERVFICDNLALTGEVRFDRKHTSRIERDLPILVGDAVGRLLDSRQSQESRVNQYQLTGLTDKDTDHLLMAVMRAGVLPPARLKQVWQEVNHPRHTEFLEYRHTVYGLYLGITEFFKDYSPFTLPRRSVRLHAILDLSCRTMRRDAALIEDAILAQEAP